MAEAEDAMTHQDVTERSGVNKIKEVLLDEGDLRGLVRGKDETP